VEETPEVDELEEIFGAWEVGSARKTSGKGEADLGAMECEGESGAEKVRGEKMEIEGEKGNVDMSGDA
jgi:hypothetical protein